MTTVNNSSNCTTDSQNWESLSLKAPELPPRDIRQVAYSVSTAWDEKQPRNPEASHMWLRSTSFEPISTNLYYFFDRICRGYMFCPCAFEPHTRSNDTFISSDLLVLDFDAGNHSLEALDDHPLISKSTLIYPTPSWTEAAKRWRVVFVLPETLDNIQTWRYAAEGLYLRCCNLPGLDAASKKPAQPYAGSRKAVRNYRFWPDAVLSQLDLDYLVGIGTPPPPPPSLPTRHSGKWDEFIALLDREMERRGVVKYVRGGWSNAIRCPFKNHDNDAHSPAGYWNRDSHCFQCFKCSQTWNAKDTGRAVGVIYE
jgi:hypothetical protein